MPFIFLLAVAVAIAFAALRYKMKQDRMKAMASVAAKLGLQFSADDPLECDRLAFQLMDKGDGSGAENVMWGTTADGRELRAFDYWYYETTSDANGNTSRSYSRFDCVTIELGIQWPSLLICPESIWGGLRDAVGFRDIQLESESFNREFNVRCDDERFATAVVDPQMMEYLQAIEPTLHVEIAGNGLLCAVDQCSPTGVGQMVGVANDVRAHIPKVVWDLYPGTTQ